jgi:hypothetical protein
MLILLLAATYRLREILIQNEFTIYIEERNKKKKNKKKMINERWGRN